MSYKLVHESGISYNVMTVEIPELTGITYHTLYASNETVDGLARSLSIAYKDRTIKVCIHARNKALYLNGKRISVIDLNDFYSNLTEEEYEATKIFCNETRKWV